jgi:hypothetical protein
MSKSKPSNCIEDELTIYKDIVSFPDLQIELRIWYQFKKDHWQKFKRTFSDADKPKSKKNFKDIAMFFTHSNLQSSMESLFLLFKIYLSIQVASAEAERSFSTLKRIKTWLRTTIGQDRLSALAVLNIERPQAADIDSDLAIDKFVEAKNRRIKFV